MDKNKNQYLTIFSNEHYFSNVFKKAERITAALYLVSNLFAEKEPLKDELRREALRVVSQLSRVSTVSVSAEGQAAREILTTLRNVMALLSIARAGGLMSQMNAAILGREYAKLYQLIESEIPKDSTERHFIFSSEFFALPDDEKMPGEALRDEIVERLLDESGFDKGQIKDNKTEKRLSPKAKASAEIDKGQLAHKKTHRELILKIAAERGKMTIKDASSIIKDCSEKTIQREILLMVAEGVLKKEGERRWSRYSLA